MAKNPYGKTVTKDKAHAVYRQGTWTWYVLKTYQTPENAAKNNNATAFCLVVTPYTGPHGDMGDTYLNDIEGELISGNDILKECGRR